MTDKVMEILNRDEKAKRANTRFIELAEKEGIKGSELEEMRKTFLSMMIANNPEAMKAMANEVWEHHNN